MHSAAHNSLRVNMNRACFHESEIKILIEKYPTMLNNLTVIMGPHSIGIWFLFLLFAEVLSIILFRLTSSAC